MTIKPRERDCNQNGFDHVPKPDAPDRSVGVTAPKRRELFQLFDLAADAVCCAQISQTNPRMTGSSMTAILGFMPITPRKIFIIGPGSHMLLLPDRITG